MKRFTPRSLVSLSAAACFLALGVTGVLLYFLKHATATAAIHTSFGALFLVVVALHVRNNFKSLTGYGHKAGDKSPLFFKKELFIILIPGLLLLAGTYYEMPSFLYVYEWGSEWRIQQENKRQSRVTYQYVETNQPGKGVTLELDVRKGKAFEYPLFAAWVEDMSGHFRQTLYVSKVIGTSRYVFGKEVDGDWVPAIVRRPEALPYWGHQRGVQAKDGYFLPDADSPVADVVSGATPNESFVLTTRTDEPIERFKLFFEVNQSFDWNEYYSTTRFPDDAIYSGSGKNGQPSVVYAATIDLTEKTRHYLLSPVGHGHHGGQDGKLDPDLSNLTTALDIVDGVLVKVLPAPQRGGAGL
jgi:hypothetical protein